MTLLKVLIEFAVLNSCLLFGINASTSTNGKDNAIPVPNSNLINTNSGPIEGIQSKTPDDAIVNIYYGIPYAVPPIGDLRFQPPRMVKPWTSTLQAVKPGLICHQDFTEDLLEVKAWRELAQRPWSEDCLTLNIWTPDPKPMKAKVVVYIHAGGFIIGSSVMQVDGTTFALEGLIVVSMNYRLSVFGFLGLGQDDAPGNVGLMDQNLALQWVKKNIEAFGGDPDDITLMGMSAGSASVGYHILSPMSKGLFQRSIMMSGAPTSWWAIREPEESISKAKQLSTKVGCPTENITLAMECLRSKHPDDILDASRSQTFFGLDHFIPTIDGKFVVEHPSVSCINGRFNPGEVVLGTTRNEGSFFMKITNPGYFKTIDGRLNRRDFLEVIKASQKGMSDLQVEALSAVYTDWTNPEDAIMLRDAAKDIYSDGMIICHVNDFADHLVKSGHTVYRYDYDYMLNIVKGQIQEHDWIGVTHAVDKIPLLAPVTMFPYFTPADLQFRRKFVKHFSRFIKTGNASLPAEEFPDEPAWPKYTRHQAYISFAEISSIHDHFRARECAAWKKLLPLLQDTQCLD